MKEERNGILVLEDVAKQVINSRRRELAMFGRRDFVTIGSTPYDFIFHHISGIPVERFSPEPYLIVPVLSYESPAELDRAKIDMSEFHQRNRDINTFAIRHRQKSKTFLRFFNANSVRLGTEIKEMSYRLAGDKDFRDLYGAKWDDIVRKLSELKEGINLKYYV